MPLALHIGNASGELTHLVKVITRAYDKASEIILEIFGEQNIDIFVLNETYHVIPEYGFGGFTPSRDIVYININKNSSNIDLKTMVSIMLHEIHHAMRWDKVGYGETLGEALVSEGLAVYLEVAYTKSVPIYSKIKLAAGIPSKAMKESDSDTYDHNSWFYGSDTIPRWSGYTLGYEMVRQFAQTQKLSLIDSVLIDAKVIIKHYLANLEPL